MSDHLKYDLVTDHLLYSASGHLVHSCAVGLMFRMSDSNPGGTNPQTGVVEIPANAAFNPVLFTYEFWFRSSIFGSPGGCLMGNRPDNSSGASIGDNSGSFDTPPYSGGGGCFIDPGPINTWHHFAASFDGTTMRAFIDGVQTVASVQAWINTPVPDPWLIGRIPQTNPYPANVFSTLEGVIRELRISSVARYIAPFTPQFTLASDGDTEGLWHMDESTGTVVNDSSSHGRHGILVPYLGVYPEWVVF